MNQQPMTVNRTMAGVIGVALLIAAAVLTLIGGDGTLEIWAGACLKVGLVMIAFWLALPSITRNENLGKASVTTVVAVLVGALIVARTKVPLKIILPVLAVAVLAVRVLRPRDPSSNRPRRDF